jgi:MFS transporter, MHS family, alpha-ketoglutarate permease
MTARSTRLRSIIGGSAGNLVEWYDWYAYSAFALYFASAFFPSDNRTIELLNTALVFAIGFLVRPIGGWLMGVYSDRHGRKAGLTLSVTLMCAGSVAIAVTPTYAQIGALAPIILTIARMAQGLSLGGEYGASATYMSEMAGRKHRGFWSSFQYVTLIGGQLTALALLVLLQSFLTEAQMDAWGWRIPFAIGGVLAVVVFWLRRRLVETESFKNAQAEELPRSGALTLFREHPREAFTVMALTAGGTLAFYAYSIYMQKFLANTTGFSREVASGIMTGALLVFMLVQPAMGALSDRIGRKPLMVGFGVLGVLATWPAFMALESVTDPYAAFAIVVGLLLINSGYSAISGVVKAEMFPAHIRALGVAFPYAIANAIFGGTAETVALWLKGRGWERGFYAYVTVMIGLSLIVYVRMKDTRDHSRIVED